jgi:hypothetical protein
MLTACGWDSFPLNPKPSEIMMQYNPSQRGKDRRCCAASPLKKLEPFGIFLLAHSFLPIGERFVSNLHLDCLYYFVLPEIRQLTFSYWHTQK